ncbi:MAG: TOBE domain-containing protein, partial [Usitatibacter sp.]
MTICDRIAVLEQGVIQQIGTPLELFDRPVNRFVAQFVGSVNLFDGTLRREAGAITFQSPLGDVKLPASIAVPENAKVEIAFRPHAVNLAMLATAGTQAGAADALSLSGTIEGGEFLGEFMRYEIRVGSALVVADQHHACGSEPLENGIAVTLTVAPREIRVIAI